MADKCQQARELLAGYRTGILSARKVAWIEQHLNECSECAEELRVLDDVLAMVDENKPEYEPPVGLWNGVYNRITSPESRPSRAYWLSKPVHAAGVGLATLVLAIGLIVSSGTHHEVLRGQKVASTQNIEYVQGHALYAGQAPLADRVSYLAVVAASSELSEAQAK